MIRMTIADMMRATDAALVAGDKTTEFEGLDIDNRRVGKGGAFVAFAGERVDGNGFCAKALEDGAAVVVMTAEPTDDVLEAARRTGGAVVRAANDDGERFLLSLAKAWRDLHEDWTVVAVTGSVGKTTTKEMLAAGIGACRRVHATEGNFNSVLGVPLTLFRAPDDAEVLVVEMGMNHAGELARMSTAARPDVAAITNVGTSHIGLLGSRQAIADAKAEVVGGMRHESATPALVLTATDDFADYITRTYCEPAGVRVCAVGGVDGMVRATDVTFDDEGRASFSLVFGDGRRLPGSLSLPGRAMVADLLSAMGVVDVLGLDRERALEAIRTMRPARMRMNVQQNPGTPRVIDDSYNASPTSMAAGLDVLCSMACEGRRVAVLGEMGELGQESTRLHAMVGAYAAAKGVDLLVLVGDEGAREMREAAVTMGFSEDSIELFGGAREAARVMGPVLEAEDLVLVKASRAVGLDQFAREVLGQ